MTKRVPQTIKVRARKGDLLATFTIATPHQLVRMKANGWTLLPQSPAGEPVDYIVKDAR